MSAGINRNGRETEAGALTRRLVERSGLSSREAGDAVDAYLHAESSHMKPPVRGTTGIIGKTDAGQSN